VKTRRYTNLTTYSTDKDAVLVGLSFPPLCRTKIPDLELVDSNAANEGYSVSPQTRDRETLEKLFLFDCCCVATMVNYSVPADRSLKKNSLAVIITNNIIE